MTAIVCNTLTGAVSEYTGFNFQSITPTHAGSALGLYELGGDLDVEAPVVANVVTGKTLIDASLKKRLDFVYFSMKGEGTSTLAVYGETDDWSYTFPVRPAGQSRSKPGFGIRENYLAFGYSNTDGSDFELDRIEVMVVPSTTRRV